MSEEQDGYVVYLLRLRKSDQDGRPTWRATLESAHGEQRLNFASLEALTAFLKARFGPQGEEHEVEGAKHQL